MSAVRTAPCQEFDKLIDNLEPADDSLALINAQSMKVNSFNISNYTA